MYSKKKKQKPRSKALKQYTSSTWSPCLLTFNMSFLNQTSIETGLQLPKYIIVNKIFKKCLLTFINIKLFQNSFIIPIFIFFSNILVFKFTLERSFWEYMFFFNKCRVEVNKKALPITLFFFPFFIGVQSKLLMHCCFTFPVFSF